MLHLQDISFEIGGNYLFKNIDWFIKPNERIALIGKNGAGKSTLLKLITGQYELREGNINKQGTLKIGYLSQDMISDDPELSVLQTAMQAFEEALEIEHTIDQLLVEIEKDPSEDNLHKLADHQERFSQLDGYQMENKTAEILEGLGFKTAEIDRPLKEFSGGWRMRAILAKMLLSQPDIMFMDEPTNHLDLPSILWLENYLSTYKGSVVIVSHDREFLNRMTNKTAELSNQRFYLWEGNYDHYLKAKVERDDLLSRQAENQKQYIKDQEKFINRFRYKATKAKAVQSRIKMLEKLEKVEEIDSDESFLSIDFKIARPSGKVLMDLKGINKTFGELELFENCNRQISRGDKIALIGANGTGKSTFLRIIANTEQFEGQRSEGHNVDASFYAQHQLESLHLKEEVLSELQHAAPHKTEAELRSLLGCFLFGGDDVYKKIKVLSGGEKARVALAKTLVSEANFLLLDEPTNHLDIASIELLIQALQNYEGSLVFVSHNRYFIDKLANKIWWIDSKQVKEYPGTYAEFLNSPHSKNRESIPEAKSTKDQKAAKNWRKPDEDKNNKRRLEQKLDKVESQKSQLKEKIAKLETALLQAQNDHEQLSKLGVDLQRENKTLEKLLVREELLLEELIALEEKP